MTDIAIDFGTSNTVVSIFDADTQNPNCLRFPQISKVFFSPTPDGLLQEVPVVPTLLFIRSQNELYLGQQVNSQRLGLQQPHRLFKSFKRELAADYRSPARNLDGIEYTPELVAQLFIEQLWERLKQQQLTPKRLILTVPVGGFDRYAYWFRELAATLGVEDVQLVDESTAAALGYAIQRPGLLVLVIDFGGGTLDLSLVRTLETEGRMTSTSELCGEVLAKSQVYLGGEDIDIWIVEDYLRSQGLSKEELGILGWQNLLEIAERLKIKLSQSQEAKESWLDEELFMSHNLILSRTQLEEILETQQLLEQVRNCLDEVLLIALGKGISKREIEAVVMVGGSSLIPAVQQLVVSYFGKQKVKLHKPFEAVAHGALAITRLSEVKDYLYHTYAIRTWNPYSKNYDYYPIFRTGTQYPCKQDQPFPLQVASQGQSEIRLDLGQLVEVQEAEVIYDASGRMTSSSLQGHSSYHSLTKKLQTCIAHLNPPGELGEDRILVQFEVDARRMLLVTVKDILTQKTLLMQQAIAKLD